ncbi:MAG: hypothetical protein V1797_03350 [Pseudomonadota bacterium]
MGFVTLAEPGLRLPKKITQKGYFADAQALAELLDLDLMAALGQEKSGEGQARRPRRRRRRRRKNGGPAPAEA